MAKYTDLQVKLPAAFSKDELEKRVAQHIEHWNHFHSCKHLQATALFELLMQFEEAIKEGRSFVLNERNGVTSLPFRCSVSKLESETKADHERIAAEVEAEYRKEISDALSLAKETIIAQRAAELKAKEAAEVAKKEAKLLAQLESEADEVLDPAKFGL